jgi:hypothetical protein
MQSLLDFIATGDLTSLQSLAFHPDDYAIIKERIPELVERAQATDLALFGGVGLDIIQDAHIPRGMCVPIFRQKNDLLPMTYRASEAELFIGGERISDFSLASYHAAPRDLSPLERSISPLAGFDAEAGPDETPEVIASRVEPSSGAAKYEIEIELQAPASGFSDFMSAINRATFSAVFETQCRMLRTLAKRCFYGPSRKARSARRRLAKLGLVPKRIEGLGRVFYMTQTMTVTLKDGRRFSI